MNENRRKKKRNEKKKNRRKKKNYFHANIALDNVRKKKGRVFYDMIFSMEMSSFSLQFMHVLLYVSPIFIHSTKKKKTRNFFRYPEMCCARHVIHEKEKKKKFLLFPHFFIQRCVCRELHDIHSFIFYIFVSYECIIIMHIISLIFFSFFFLSFTCMT